MVGLSMFGHSALPYSTSVSWLEPPPMERPSAVSGVLHSLVGSLGAFPKLCHWRYSCPFATNAFGSMEPPRSGVHSRGVVRSSTNGPSGDALVARPMQGKPAVPGAFDVAE